MGPPWIGLGSPQTSDQIWIWGICFDGCRWRFKEWFESLLKANVRNIQQQLWPLADCWPPKDHFRPSWPPHDSPGRTVSPGTPQKLLRNLHFSALHKASTWTPIQMRSSVCWMCWKKWTQEMFWFPMVSGTRLLVADPLSAKGFELGPQWVGLVLHVPWMFDQIWIWGICFDSCHWRFKEQSESYLRVNAGNSQTVITCS